MTTPETNQNALATPLRSTAAVFSDEVETLTHVARVQAERERFQIWWESFNPDNDLGPGTMRLCWESWKASARQERHNV
jgi:hypothetical protein